MKKAKDLVGTISGRLIVLSHYRENNRTWLKCKCDCGNEKNIMMCNFVSGVTKSCGCLKREEVSARNLAKTNIEIGDIFGSLTVSAAIDHVSGRSKSVCTCKCGKIVEVNNVDLKSGNTTSCGCSRRTHNLSNTRIYRIWNKMISRCHNVNDKDYDNYGGRGIKVCEEWHSIENFARDMSGLQDSNLTLDRINNNIGYCKENCKLSTMEEQANNKRTNRMLLIDGYYDTLSNQSKRLGLSPSCILRRIGSSKLNMDTPSRKANVIEIDYDGNEIRRYKDAVELSRSVGVSYERVVKAIKNNSNIGGRIYVRVWTSFKVRTEENDLQKHGLIEQTTFGLSKLSLDDEDQQNVVKNKESELCQKITD